MINLVAKLRIVKLKRRKKEKREKFDAPSHKQEVLPAPSPRRSMPGVTHRFPRSVIPLPETVGRRQARNSLCINVMQTVGKRREWRAQRVESAEIGERRVSPPNPGPPVATPTPTAGRRYLRIYRNDPYQTFHFAVRTAKWAASQHQNSRLNFVVPTAKRARWVVRHVRVTDVRMLMGGCGR